MADVGSGQHPGSPVAYPHLVLPPAGPTNLVGWAATRRQELLDQLRTSGALLFRDFNPLDPEGLRELIGTLSGETLDYSERSSPRTEVAEHIYTSTDYPARERIPLHCENSYKDEWPLHLYFLCVQPAGEGGETPIADTRRVRSRIGDVVVDRFTRLGWMYVRNFGPELGLSWQTVFQTEDRRAVERYCEAHGIELEWRPGNRLRTRARRPVIGHHASTGEAIWFNHIAFFHVSSLDPRTASALRTLFDDEDLPSNTYYGDGTPIEPETLAAISSAFDAEQTPVEWRRGDLLLVDNMLTAHGRSPYRGERRILVGMSCPTSLQAPEHR